MIRRALSSLFGINSKVSIGDFFPDRTQPELSKEETALVDRFHDLYYSSWLRSGRDTINISWFGYKILKCPMDLWIYQELIVRHRPSTIVETGTFDGGSALFMAMIMDVIGSGQIISIDIERKAHRPHHPRIRYITGSSVDPGIVASVRKDLGGAPAMVILDSDHSAAHVYNEMLAYHTMVPVGGYMIVEDTNVNGHPTFPDFGPGPTEAVERFMGHNSEFEIDKRCHRFMMTLNPNGYLRRIAPAR